MTKKQIKLHCEQSKYDEDKFTLTKLENSVEWDIGTVFTRDQLRRILSRNETRLSTTQAK